jgi:hypothetical protein
MKAENHNLNPAASLRTMRMSMPMSMAMPWPGRRAFGSREVIN